MRRGADQLLGEVADTVLRQGQGMHGSFSRGDTYNFMAAIGPDFKAGFVDELPVSNADVGMTAARLMGLRARRTGGLVGRVMSEALPNGIIPKAFKAVGSRRKSPRTVCETVLKSSASQRSAISTLRVSPAERSAWSRTPANKKRRGNNPAACARAPQGAREYLGP